MIQVVKETFETFWTSMVSGKYYVILNSDYKGGTNLTEFWYGQK